MFFGTAGKQVTSCWQMQPSCVMQKPVSPVHRHQVCWNSAVNRSHS